jgi:RNA polymerase sigma factor (sigma-70 family)
MIEKSDKELLELFQKSGDANQAFELIVRKYQRKIYQVIRRLLVDHDDTHDVMQNTFIKAWKGLSNFREDAQLYTWLYRIATNESLTFLSKSKKNLQQSIDDYFELSNHADSSVPDLNGEDIQHRLQRAIETLPEKQRVVFNMKYYDELKYEEMSEILDTSVGALKASYHIAVKKIEEYLRQTLNQAS